MNTTKKYTKQARQKIGLIPKPGVLANAILDLATAVEYLALEREPPKARGMGAIKDPARRSEIANKAVATRKRNILAKKRSKAAYKAAATRRRNQG